MSDIAQLWQLVVDVWSKGLWGVDVGRILLAIGILYVAFMVRGVFTTVVLGAINRWSARTKSQWDDHLAAGIRGPVRLIPITVGVFFAAQYADLDAKTLELAHNVVKSMVVISIFWAAHNLVDSFSGALKKLRKMFTPAMVKWMVKSTKIVFIFLGVATVLELWGIKVGPILAGFGLFGVGVALAAQDLFKNLIAGLLVIAEKRFHEGDWIKIDGVVEGTVERIDFRSTSIRQFDKALVQVPNAKLSDNALTNYSAMTHRRIYWKIGVEYGTNVTQLKQVRDGIEAYLHSNDAFDSSGDVPLFVRVDAFNDSSIDLMIYCFTKTTVWGEWLEIKEQFAYAIKEIVEGAGTAFAFPSQSLYIERVPGDAPEVFTPPETKRKKSA